jgi:signal transduction histidine kinase
MILGNATPAYAVASERTRERNSNYQRQISWENSGGNARLRLEAQRRERNRIARELHDTYLQGFAGALFLLHKAEEQTRSNSPAKLSIGRAVRLIRESLDEARSALQGLRSLTPGPTSLEHALAALRDEHALDADIGFRVFVAGQPKELQPAIQKQIYLIGREAVINAFRHSRATKIEAEIEYLRRQVRLLVRDNGCGIDPKTLAIGCDSHWGLLGMRERAESIGASLRIWSKPGLGTEIELRSERIRPS